MPPCAALAQGYGTFESPDGARYVGNWASNLKHGIGKKTYANGDSYEGLWNLGKAEGPGRCDAGGRRGRHVSRCAAPFGEVVPCAPSGAMCLKLCRCVLPAREPCAAPSLALPVHGLVTILQVCVAQRQPV